MSRERADLFVRALEPVARDLAGSELLGLLEVAERLQDALDDVWSPAEGEGFPEDRMQRLVQVRSTANDLSACGAP